MAAQRVVKLKPDPKPKGPAIRLYRADNGFGFVVGCVGKDGTTDFRSESEHSSFEEAVKWAQARVDQFKLPLINDTGVDIPTKAQPAAPRVAPAQTKAAPKPKTKTAADWQRELDELPDPFAKFYDPEVSADAAAQDYEENGELRAHHAHVWFKERRALAIEHHEQLHGNTRDHAVLFSQKLYDQLQTQIYQLYGALYDERALILADLKQAIARIDELERAPKGLNYRGVYSPNETYKPSDVVTWSGSAWVCKRQTADKPGEGDRDTAAWQLMVKKGRDGRDIRDRKES